MANSTISARIEPKLKHDAEVVLANMGLTVSDAVRLLMMRVAQDKKLPFEPFSPNSETVSAMEDARADRTMKGGRDIKSVMAALDAD